MPKKLPQLGGSNINNLEAMVAAGMITKKEADMIRRKARVRKQSKSLKD